jgi:general stress protein 26
VDSINQNQPEDNRRDLRAKEAIDKIKELVGEAKSCFFCTSFAAPGSTAARPMSVQKVDKAGHLWFLSADDSHKNAELERNPSVTLYFQGSAHSDFLMLSGTASVSRDRAKIEELWEPVIKTWFTGGVDDPRITVIEVTPAEGYYWDNKHGNALAGIKMIIGAAVGKTLDDSVEGKIDV